MSAGKNTLPRRLGRLAFDAWHKAMRHAFSYYAEHEQRWETLDDGHAAAWAASALAIEEWAASRTAGESFYDASATTTPTGLDHERAHEWLTTMVDLGIIDRYNEGKAEARLAELLAATRRETLQLDEGWITEDDKPIAEDALIDEAFPTRSREHGTYQDAMRMVGAKYTKGALLALVNWLLVVRKRQRLALMRCLRIARYHDPGVGACVAVDKAVTDALSPEDVEVAVSTDAEEIEELPR